MKSYKKFWKLGIEEFGTKDFDINKDEELIIREGNYQYNILDLIKKFGTPLEIFFPFIIEKRLRNLFETFNYYTKNLQYKGRFYYYFPMKVNQNKEFVLSLISEGANLEVGSANELWLVKRMWEQNQFDPKIKVICNGPKTNYYLSLISELKEKNLNIIPVIEDRTELKSLRDYRGDIGIRFDLDVRTKSHWDKKIDRYGFSFQEIIELGKIKNLKIIHYHNSSQVERLEDLINQVKRAIDVFVKIKEKNPTLDTLDLGGGFAVPYLKKKMYTADQAIKRIIRIVKNAAEKAEIPHPNLICEWGRYIVAPSQITIYKILFEKKIEKSIAKKWYIIDGSFMNDLIDTWAIRQKWHVVPINFMKTKLSRVWLAGSSCDSDDKYTAGGNYISLPKLEELGEAEDLYIAFLDTGAYQDALASHHCLLSSPAKIVAQKGILMVARKRETAEEVGKLFGW